MARSCSITAACARSSAASCRSMSAPATGAASMWQSARSYGCHDGEAQMLRSHVSHRSSAIAPRTSAMPSCCGQGTCARPLAAAKATQAAAGTAPRRAADISATSTRSEWHTGAHGSAGANPICSRCCLGGKGRCSSLAMVPPAVMWTLHTAALPQQLQFTETFSVLAS